MIAMHTFDLVSFELKQSKRTLHSLLSKLGILQLDLNRIGHPAKMDGCHTSIARYAKFLLRTTVSIKIWR